MDMSLAIYAVEAKGEGGKEVQCWCISEDVMGGVIYGIDIRYRDLCGGLCEECEISLSF